MSHEQAFIFDPDHYPLLAIESVPNGAVISILVTELKDQLVLEDVEKQIIHFVKSHVPRRLVIDFKSVKFMSSMMLRSLIRIRDWVVGNNGQLKLANLHPHLREVFRITELENRLFFLYDSIEDALR
ncbi:MAG: STAS domain-containing protein [Pirellulales bacterium]